MIASDLVRFGVFAALPFVDSAEGLVVARRRHGCRDRVLLPGGERGDPEPRPDEELANANSLTVTVDTLADDRPGRRRAAVRGLGAVGAVRGQRRDLPRLRRARRPDPDSKLRSEDPLTRGHWRDVADGVEARRHRPAAPHRAHRLERRAARLGAVNVAEVFFAKDTLDAGDLGYGALVAASGVGLALGSFLARPRSGRSDCAATTSARSCSWGWGGGRLR